VQGADLGHSQVCERLDIRQGRFERRHHCLRWLTACVGGLGA
jgi:hypothetical protein